MCAVVTCTCDDCCTSLFLSRGLFELSRFRRANKADINQTRLDKHLWLAPRLMFMPLVLETAVAAGIMFSGRPFRSIYVNVISQECSSHICFVFFLVVFFLDLVQMVI